MIKKKDPYLALLDFYYEKFPETMSLDEAYDFFHREGYISTEEREIIKGFGSERQKKDPEVERSAEKKRMTYLTMFRRAGDTTELQTFRNVPRIINPEHYFHRLEYIELIEARKSSRLAFITSILAIIISLGSLYIAWSSFQKPTVILDSQIQEIVSAIEELQNDVHGK